MQIYSNGALAFQNWQTRSRQISSKYLKNNETYKNALKLGLEGMESNEIEGISLFNGPNSVLTFLI
jgi:hypothetical protein